MNSSYIVSHKAHDACISNPVSSGLSAIAGFPCTLLNSVLMRVYRWQSLTEILSIYPVRSRTSHCVSIRSSTPHATKPSDVSWSRCWTRELLLQAPLVELLRLHTEQPAFSISVREKSYITWNILFIVKEWTKSLTIPDNQWDASASVAQCI